MTLQLGSGFLVGCDLFDTEMGIRLVGLFVCVQACVHVSLNAGFLLCMCVYGYEKV